MTDPITPPPTEATDAPHAEPVESEPDESGEDWPED